MLLRALSATALLLASTTLTADEGATRLLRFPDVHRDFVVFSYAGDIWRAPTDGGTARRLTAHPGVELFPTISPDGRHVAFTAEHVGTRQVFVMPADGGDSEQLTFYNDVGSMPPRGGWDYWIQDWTPDGKILVRANRTPWGERMGRYFLVDPAGGLETPLELPEGGSASLSPDGKRLAYCPVSREFRTWKRTRGGRAQDIWIYDLDRRRSRRLTSAPSTENFPMWHGDRIYYTSDQDYTLNLYAHDLTSGSSRRLTRFEDFDVLWPKAGPESIVFTHGGQLWLLPLPDGAPRRIPVEVRSDLPGSAPRLLDVSDQVEHATLSPGGERVVVAARGELFSVPAEHGSTRNLTRTPGIREMSPAWSPDGARVAFLSDRSGEYEIYLRSADGSGEERRLTKDGSSWRYPPVWSPDSRRLAYADRNRRLAILDVEDGRETEVDRGEQGDLTTFTWSPDSRWLAYERSHPTRLPGIAVYSLDRKQRVLLGDGLTADTEPAFSADGSHLFFLSNRDFNLRFSAFEFNYLYDSAGRVYAAALTDDAAPLFPTRNDEYRVPEEEEKDEPTAEKKTPQVRIEPEGFTARTVALPGLPHGDYGELGADDGAVFYQRAGDGGPPTLYRYDLAARKEEKVLDGVSAWTFSADRKKILYRAGNRVGVVPAKAGIGDDQGALDLSGLRIRHEPRREWAQAYRDAWRIARDWFYDPAMHGKDWDEIGDRYAELLPDVAHPSDFEFVLGELISELDAGHTYVQSAPSDEVERIPGGLLGCELEAHAGGYRITKIFPGENWHAEWRSPLTEPGIDARLGDYLVAIDGVPLTSDDNPYRLLEGKADRSVSLELNDRPNRRGARTAIVVPIASEGNLRYLDWVTERMRLADRLSGGRVGYLHLPNTAGAGNRALQKLFWSQVAKPALIIDDRYNGGGFIPDRMIEYFTRRTLAWWGRRDIASMRTPNFAHDGPKAMLINGYSSSGGDALPYFFKANDLGVLIGTRTWGGLIGLTGNPSLVNGATVLIPTFRIYDRDRAWVVENEGVSPDIEVVDLPEERIAGRDPSLERAVEWLLERLEESEFVHPDAPTPPDHSR